MSEKNKVKNALPNSFIYCGNDSVRSNDKCSEFKQKGYSTFNYKTFGTSETLITENLISFPPESAVFVVFHELTHNYISDNQMKIPYQLNEAVCEVLGIYFRNDYFNKNGNEPAKEKCKKDMIALQEIYKTINNSIININSDSERCDAICLAAQKDIFNITTDLDIFFKGRFNYEINTAYFLKSQNYSKYYFDVEKIYLENPDFNKFITEIKKLALQINGK